MGIFYYFYYTNKISERKIKAFCPICRPFFAIYFNFCHQFLRFFNLLSYLFIRFYNLKIRYLKIHIYLCNIIAYNKYNKFPEMKIPEGIFLNLIFIFLSFVKLSFHQLACPVRIVSHRLITSGQYNSGKGNIHSVSDLQLYFLQFTI